MEVSRWQGLQHYRVSEVVSISRLWQVIVKMSHPIKSLTGVGTGTGTANAWSVHGDGCLLSLNGHTLEYSGRSVKIDQSWTRLPLPNYYRNHRCASQ